MSTKVFRHAVIDETGTYRYWLSRWWGDEPPVLFIMLNPSTADGMKDDPTIRRCMRFAKDWGYGGLLVGNLYAYRATDPQALALAGDAIGPENDEYLQMMAAQADRIIVAWGRSNAEPARITRVLSGVLKGRLVSCLGTTKSGDPRHPLYVRANTVPEDWKP